MSLVRCITMCPNCNEDFEVLVNNKVLCPRLICGHCDAEFFVEDLRESAYFIPVQENR